MSKTADVVSRWRDTGVNNGDVVLLHSSVSRMMRTIQLENPNFSLTDLLDSLLAAVGTNGTLLLPTFNFTFCNQKKYDYSRTPSAMGALTEAGRLDARFERTQHPVYSFAVSGKYAKDFAKLENVSALADDGPFGLLRRLDGKISVVDLDDQNSMTIYHHIEEVNQVSYRYHKSFTGTYRDRVGDESVRTYQLFVWDEIRGTRTDVNRAGELLWEQGHYVGNRPGVGTGIRTIRAEAMFLSITEVIQRGAAREYLYSIEKSHQL